MRKLLWSIATLSLLTALPPYALAQVAFQPIGCDFRAVFVITPDIKVITMPDDSGKLQKETVASLGVLLDGKPNFFRAECMNVEVPKTIDEAFLLDDMKTLAAGNNLKSPTVWIERSASGETVGRVRGLFADTVATYQLEVRRYFSRSNIFDVWIGSPPGTFPSEGNIIFLKELRRNGQALN